MANKTTNYGLTKPLQTEFYDIDVHNANMDIIDTQLKNINNKFNGLSTDAGDMTGILPIAHGGTGATTASEALNKLGAAPSNHDHYYAGSSTVGGSATSAERLTDGKTIRTDLGKTSAVKFNGTENVEVGVTGVLPVANGGTGANSVANAQSALGIVPMNDIPNLHIWGKYTGNPSGYTLGANGSATVGASAYSGTYDVKYSDTVELVDGKVKLVNPATVVGSSAETFDVIKGKFVEKGRDNAPIYFVSQTATIELSGGIKVSSAQLVTANSSEPLGYVASKENNTYPTNGQHTDGYWYKYSKQLGASEHTFGTTDLTAGTSALETGKLYFVYE
jgi:hypothetical protein